jgi:hypothetical protein
MSHTTVITLSGEFQSLKMKLKTKLTQITREQVILNVHYLVVSYDPNNQSQMQISKSNLI